MAIYIKHVDDILKPHLLLVDGDGEIAASNEGLIWARHPDIEVSNDIVGKWKDEQINEELNLIADWFKHIAQMADDKKTLNGIVMKDSDAFDEIKCLAKSCAEYVDKRLLSI